MKNKYIPTPISNLEETLTLLKHGVVDLVSKNELIEKLKLGRPLKIKLGADPSAPDIHLGHVVVLKKLKQFQDLGHEVIFLIGDFTGMIGDPTGKTKTRIPLTPEQVKKNTETYQKQIFKILDSKKTIIRFNSEWLSLMTFRDVISLTSRYTLARLLEREDFSNRYHNQQSITITELLYPLIQGYDSVCLNADVELGGTDQLFNLLVGRELQKEYGQPSQVVMTLPLLEGLDGKMKMSKSLGNYIGIQDNPKEMFGKAMSLPDEMISRYFYLITDIPTTEIKEMEKDIEKGTNPRDIKIRLAHEIVKIFHDKKSANKAESEFIRIFSQGGLPDNLPELEIKGQGDVTEIKPSDLLQFTGLFKSNSEIRRLVDGGGVKLNDIKLTDSQSMIKFKEGDLLKVGKRNFFRITFK